MQTEAARSRIAQGRLCLTEPLGTLHPPPLDTVVRFLDEPRRWDNTGLRKTYIEALV